VFSAARSQGNNSKNYRAKAFHAIEHHLVLAPAFLPIVANGKVYQGTNPLGKGWQPQHRVYRNAQAAKCLCLGLQVSG